MKKMISLENFDLESKKTCLLVNLGFESKKNDSTGKFRIAPTAAEKSRRHDILNVFKILADARVSVLHSSLIFSRTTQKNKT